MIDIGLIRKNPEWVKEQIAKLNDSAPIDEILAADTRRREIIQREEALQRQLNLSSKSIGQRMGQLKRLEAQIREAEANLEADNRPEIDELRANAAELERQ
ncbi:MAG TPA: hypothetical protein VLE70_07195, partial [Anaerolineae bacterium]|nr:hypothetical protein [Anaerolineae bacterium]